MLACVICLILCSFAEDTSAFINKIGFIGEKTRKTLGPPKKLVIGIDTSMEAYYKFSDKENVIKGGLFQRGLNTVDIEALDLFEKPGTHIYYLDLKVDDRIEREKIEIDIQLDTPKSEPGDQSQVRGTEYEVSMFIGGQLVVTGKKVSFKELSFKIDKPPLPEGYGPFYEIEKEYKNPMVNSFSIIHAAAAIYDLIKKAIDKKKMQRNERPIQMHKQLAVTFLRRDSEGVSREINAAVELKTVKDISGNVPPFIESVEKFMKAGVVPAGGFLLSSVFKELFSVFFIFIKNQILLELYCLIIVNFVIS